MSGDINGGGVKRWADLIFRAAREPLVVIVAVLAFLLAQDAGLIPSKSSRLVELLGMHIIAAGEETRRRDEAEARLLDVLNRKIRTDRALCLALAREPGAQKICLDP